MPCHTNQKIASHEMLIFIMMYVSEYPVFMHQLVSSAPAVHLHCVANSKLVNHKPENVLKRSNFQADYFLDYFIAIAL